MHLAVLANLVLWAYLLSVVAALVVLVVDLVKDGGGGGGGPGDGGRGDRGGVDIGFVNALADQVAEEQEAAAIAEF